MLSLNHFTVPVWLVVMSISFDEKFPGQRCAARSERQETIGGRFDYVSPREREQGKRNLEMRTLVERQPADGTSFRAAVVAALRSGRAVPRAGLHSSLDGDPEARGARHARAGPLTSGALRVPDGRTGRAAAA
ncbi:hypothetical protein GCM10028796_15480 [Ramlibacter monticola]